MSSYCFELNQLISRRPFLIFYYYEYPENELDLSCILATCGAIYRVNIELYVWTESSTSNTLYSSGNHPHGIR